MLPCFSNPFLKINQALSVSRSHTELTMLRYVNKMYAMFMFTLDEYNCLKKFQAYFFLSAN